VSSYDRSDEHPYPIGRELLEKIKREIQENPNLSATAQLYPLVEMVVEREFGKEVLPLVEQGVVNYGALLAKVAYLLDELGDVLLFLSEEVEQGKIPETSAISIAQAGIEIVYWVLVYRLHMTLGNRRRVAEARGRIQRMGIPSPLLQRLYNLALRAVEMNMV